MAESDPPKSAGPAAGVPEAQRARGEDGIPLIWQPGDVILDLYEVRPFSATMPFIEGGMGRVNCVYHRGWNRLLAVKSVRPNKLASAAAVENFEREAEVWVDKLGLHPHVVCCQYVRELGSLPRLFMDFMPGGSLKEWIESGKLYEGGPDRALERILDIAIQFAWGLHHAHEQGLIHQDVKPANVLMTLEGVARVTDFGLARARAEAGEQGAAPVPSTLLATWGGMTPAYCSPEQAEIAAKAGVSEPRERWPKLGRGTDVWSWAVSVLEMFTGRVAWPSGSVAGHYLKRNVGDPRIPKMPSAVAEVLERCFKRQPEERLRNMHEVAEALRGIYERIWERHPRELPESGESLADNLNNRAVSLFDLGKQQEAAQKWQEALRVDPHHPETTYNWGLIQWRSLRMTDKKLLEKLRSVRASSADSARVDYLMGLVHLERADAQTAVEVLSKAVEAGTGRAEITAALALAQSLSDPSDGESSEEYPRTFEGHTGQVESVWRSPDGRYALSAGGENLGAVRDKSLKLLDVSSGKCLRTFEGHTSAVTCVSWSPDGRRALSGSWDNTLRLWDVSSGKCLRTFEGHTYMVTSVALSPDGRYALSAGGENPGFIRDNTLRLWDVSSGQCLRVIEGFTRDLNCTSWSRYTLRLWGIASPKQPIPLVTSVAFAVGPTRYSQLLRQAQGVLPNKPAVAAGFLKQARQEPGCSRRRDALDLARQLCRFLPRRGFVAGWELRVLSDHTRQVNSACFSPDGRHAVSGGWDEKLRLWDVASGQCVRTFGGHTKCVFGVSWSADGRKVVSAGADHTLRLWEAASWNWLRTLDAHTGPVTSVSWSPDCHRVLSASYDKTIRLWDISSGECLHVFQGHTKEVVSVSWSPDGRWALSGSADKTSRLWDVSSGQCLRTFQGHRNRVTTVAWQPGGSCVLTGSYDKSLRLWDVSSGHCIRSFKGHTDKITSASWSPDGRWVLTGSADNTIRLWDTSSGKCFRTFEGHVGLVASVSWSADGCRALSASWDTTLRLWELDWEYELTQSADWDEGARPFLTNFITVQASTPGLLSWPRRVALFLRGRSQPIWTEEQFQRLLERLAYAGYGWLRPEGVRRELEKIAAAWQGPPPLA